MKKLSEFLIKEDTKVITESLEVGSKLTHKHDPKITIELIEPTNRGWKVKQSTRKGKNSKEKTAYFDSQDLKGEKSLFTSGIVSEHLIKENAKPQRVLAKKRLHKADGTGSYKDSTGPICTAKKGGDKIKEDSGNQTPNLSLKNSTMGPYDNIEEEGDKGTALRNIVTIAQSTGTKVEVIDAFIKEYKLDSGSLSDYVGKGNLDAKMEVLAAIHGKPSSPYLKKIIRVFQTPENSIEESDDNGLYNSGDKTQGMPTIGEKGEPGKWSKQEDGMPVMESSTMERRRYRLKQSQMEMIHELHSIQEGIKKMDKGENPHITKKQQTITEHQTKFFEEATKKVLD